MVVGIVCGVVVILLFLKYGRRIMEYAKMKWLPADRESVKLLLLTGIVYFAPVYFLVVFLLLLLGAFSIPPGCIFNSCFGIIFMSLVVNIFSLVAIRDLSGKRYLRFKMSLIYFFLFSAAMPFIFNLFDFDFLSEGVADISLRWLLSPLVIGIIIAVCVIIYCIDGKIGNWNLSLKDDNDKKKFVPNLKWYLGALLIAMILGGGEMAFFYGPKVVYFFPGGFLAFIFFLWRSPNHYLEASWIGWLFYSGLIALGAFLRSRIIWYIFVILLLINIASCRLILLGLSKLH
jgi:hypothetical protein